MNPCRPETTFRDWLATVSMDSNMPPLSDARPAAHSSLPAVSRRDRPARAAAIAAAGRREIERLRAAHAAEVEALREQLLQARKQASLGELLGTTTHEFNNALTTILNYARLGLRHRDQPTRDKALERILSAGNRAAKITASVLSMARNRSARFEPVDLHLLVEDVLVLLEREMMKYRVQVEREFAQVPRVSANPGQLQQVLLNLMVNARQAMPEGGRLILRLSHDATSGLVDLMVRDTGCGMPPEVLRKIFQPHFSTKQGPDETGKGGSGLGLSSCREIVEAHHGRIRAESAPGRGTAITVRLPALAQATPAG
ncbi:MAG: ATP-binding protein [Planctomycetota bacterium]|nr:ATP-binding protein [Planctomycetota bacterium]MDA1201939.1 ATP-binding protein [Planctomycetota bacterium]